MGLAGILLCLQFMACPQASSIRHELTWSAREVLIFPDAIDTLEVAGLGVNDTVYVLPVDTLDFIEKIMINEGPANLPAGTAYEVRATLEKMKLVIPVGQASKYHASVDTLYDTIVAGPAPLRAGGEQALRFGINEALDCGLHRLILRIDEQQRVQGDSVKLNNNDTTFVFVQSAEIFNVRALPGDTAVYHDPQVQVGVFNFELSVPGGEERNVLYTAFKLTLNNGSQLVSNPKPGGMITIPKGGVARVRVDLKPVDLNLHPDKKGHPAEIKIGKGTFVSEDGCILKQQSGKVLIE